MAGRPAPARGQSRLSLLGLPPELQVNVSRHLDFADFHQLRRTCRYFHAFVDRNLIVGALQEPMREILLSHCYVCLCRNDARTQLFWADPADPRYPFASRCIECAVRNGDLVMGKKYSLGNFATVWPCRWCGYPVEYHSDLTFPELHEDCYRRYNRTVQIHCLLGIVQIAANISAAAICWHLYPGDRIILSVTIVAFILAVGSLLWRTIHPKFVRSSAVSLIFELASISLWVVIVHKVCPYVSSGQTTRMGISLLVLTSIVILFRLVNALGYVVLTCGYKIRYHNHANASPVKRLLHRLATCIVYFVWPNYIMLDYCSDV